MQRIKNLIIEKTNATPQKGDNVYLENGEPAPSGKYIVDTFNRLTVDNGKFVKW